MNKLSGRVLLAFGSLGVLLLGVAVAGWLANRVPPNRLADLHVLITALGTLGAVAGVVLGLTLAQALRQAAAAQGPHADDPSRRLTDDASTSLWMTASKPAATQRAPRAPITTAPASVPAQLAAAGPVATPSAPTASVAGEAGDADMLRLQQAVAAMQASLRDVMRGVREKAEAQRQALGALEGLANRAAQLAPEASGVAAQGAALRAGPAEEPAPPATRPAPRVHQLATAAGPLTLVSAEPSLRIDHAVDAAQRSAEVVSQVVGNLEEISTASRRILDTVNLIDSIAFQTNLLALNATVEAARAGDQGRAARVVAADVRMLAQRAASAAREIKGLMGDTLHKLEAGGRGLREGSHTTMDAIVTSVQCVTDIVGHIQQTPAAAGSVVETAEVSIEQLDQMTQQNIALVQQSAGAAEALRVQAERLQKVVSAFRLLQHTQEAAWTAHSAISGARRSARLGSSSLAADATGDVAGDEAPPPPDGRPPKG
jgi:methyl-accepting chemotaxis protein